MLADLDELDASLTVSQARPKGRLRIDVSAAIAQRIILPALGGFFDQYPDMQLDIGSSDRPVDLLAENVDCVIRAGTIGDLSLVARRIGELHMLTVAAPAYLSRHGAPTHPSVLEQGHQVVAYFSARTGRHLPFEFVRGPERLEVMGRYQAAANEAGIYVAAGLAGYGVIQAPYFMLRDHVEAGRLQQVLPDWSVPATPLHVVYPPNKHLSTRLRIFVDWAASLFAKAPLAPARHAEQLRN